MKRALREGRFPRWSSPGEGRTAWLSRVLDAIPLDIGGVNLTLPALKSRLVPLTATDADGDTLSYTVTSTNATSKPRS